VKANACKVKKQLTLQMNQKNLSPGKPYTSPFLGRPQFNLLAVAAAAWREVIETHAERREKAKYMKNCRHSLLPVQFECSPQKLQQPCHHIQKQVRTISLVCNLPLSLCQEMEIGKNH
jgi:hypothetical protein